MTRKAGGRPSPLVAQFFPWWEFVFPVPPHRECLSGISKQLKQLKYNYCVQTGVFFAFHCFMRGFPVYCVSGTDGAVERVGSILELRKSHRSMNRVALAKLAQKIFSRNPGDIIYLGSQSALERAESLPETALNESAG